ncbi:MAG: tetratricopeptide repeat protein [Caldilineales bacterium]|nr:tetratricopeptide repeat protein [Caldilineales bacterium]
MSDVLLAGTSKELKRLLDIGEYEAGFALGRHILRYYPRHLETYAQLGIAAVQAGLFADAADVLRRALSGDPESGELWQAMFQAAAALGLTKEADIAARHAGDLNPEQAQGQLTDMAQAALAAQHEDWSAALQAYHNAYEQDEARMDAALGLATTLWRVQRVESARTLAEIVSEELPFSLKAQLLLAMTAEQEGDAPAAEQHRRIALSLDPDGLYAWRWFGDPGQPSPPPAATLPAWDSSVRWPLALS